MNSTTLAISDIKFGNVVKSNNLIEAKYDLSLLEQKFILLAISLIQHSKNIVKIKVKDFCRLMGSSQDRYVEIRNIVRDLRRKEILITKYDNKNDIEEELVAGWINTSLYKNGEIEIEFPQRLMPYLVELKDRYTMYNLSNIAHLDSKYSIRMYELLKEHEFKRNVTIDFNKLKETICCVDKFDRYYDFKKRVLLSAQEELSAKTDICFSFNEIRNGKTVTALNFQIFKNQKIIEEREKITITSQTISYYGENSVENVVDKYKRKTKEVLTEELQNLILIHHGATMNLDEIDKFNKKTIIGVIFGIVDGEFKDVKAPLQYFKKVLRQREQELEFDVLENKIS